MFQPQYQITAKVLRQLNRLEVIRSNIAQCRIHPKEEYHLKRSAISSMVHHSTAIEGNTLSQFEVDRVLKGENVQASMREINEVKNYKKALDYIGKRKSPNITPNDILKIHKITTKNILDFSNCGVYRREPVYVVKRTLTAQQIVYTAPSEKKVQELVQNLCDWINASRKEKLSPIIIAGLAHSEIAGIHPFADGNGRTARLLATMILYTENYDFRKLFALENYYNSERQLYYRAIDNGKNYDERSQNSLTPWLEYFTEGFLSEMERVIDVLKPLILLKSVKQGKVVISKNEIKILDFLQEMNSLTSNDVVDILSVTKRTAQRYLENLIKKDLVKREGENRNARYFIAD